MPHTGSGLGGNKRNVVYRQNRHRNILAKKQQRLAQAYYQGTGPGVPGLALQFGENLLKIMKNNKNTNFLCVFYMNLKFHKTTKKYENKNLYLAYFLTKKLNNNNAGPENGRSGGFWASCVLYLCVLRKVNEG